MHFVSFATDLHEGENSERQPFDHVPKMTDGHVDHVINKLQPKNSTHLTCYTARKLTA